MKHLRHICCLLFLFVILSVLSATAAESVTETETDTGRASSAGSEVVLAGGGITEGAPEMSAGQTAGTEGQSAGGSSSEGVASETGPSQEGSAEDKSGEGQSAESGAAGSQSAEDGGAGSAAAQTGDAGSTAAQDGGAGSADEQAVAAGSAAGQAVASGSADEQAVAAGSADEQAGSAGSAAAQAGTMSAASVQAAGDETASSQTPVTEAAQEQSRSESETESEEMARKDPMFALEAGEEVTIYVNALPGMRSSGSLSAADDEKIEVKVRIAEVYEYDDLGLGDGSEMFTNKYRVTFNGITTIAYCLQPAKKNPKMSENFTLSRLDDGQDVAKILYYAVADAEHGGYFANNHPDYDDGTQFIITHMAAAKVSGASAWAKGANQTAKDEADAFIAYVAGMPALGDAAISFSPSSVGAADGGNVVRSERITLNGSQGNTAVLPLPAGVSLENQTDASRSGSGEVTIAAGDVFTLTYPKPAPEGYSFSATATGTQLLDFSAYKIHTDNDTQDLGLIFAEGITGQNTAPLSVRLTPDASVSVLKKDAGSGHALSGAVFGLYAGANMKEADGSSRSKGDLLERVTTGSDGKAAFTRALSVGCSYYVQEIQAPQSYIRNTSDIYSFTFGMGSGSQAAQTFSHTFSDTAVKGRITLNKRDKDKGASAQGDASLKGAVYGLYADGNILSPDQSGTVLYSSGAQIATATTDAQGKIVWSGLPLGKYSIREISPSEGYLLDKTTCSAVLSYVNDTTAEVTTEVTVQEQVIRQPFQLIKVSEGSGSDAELLQGAGFTAWLVSSLSKDGEGYDYSSAKPVALCADGSAEMFTDAKGYAVSVPLPYGTYIVRETTVPAHHSPVRDFTVRVTEDHPNAPQVWRVLLDGEFQAKLRIIKADSESGQAVLRPDTEFRVYDVEKECYVEQRTTYPVSQVHTSYLTDASGTLTLPESLKSGTYRIEEVTPPEGYLPAAGEVIVQIDETAPVLQDSETGELIVETVVEDTPVKGKLELVKKGPMLTGFEDGRFIYEIRGIYGAQFEVKAAEDIRRPDMQTDEDGEPIWLYREGDTVVVLTTDENGEASAEDLPLGKYTVTETKAPYGCVLIQTPYEVELQADGESPVVTEHLEITDPRQTLLIQVRKVSADGEKVPLSGAEFTLYAGEDIHARSTDGETPGPVIAGRGAALFTAATDADGVVQFAQDLPHAVYIVRETKAPSGYQLNKEKYVCDGTYLSGEQQTVFIEQEVPDTPEPEPETEPVKPETEPVQPKTEQVQSETEQVQSETEQVQSETEQVQSETEKKNRKKKQAKKQGDTPAGTAAAAVSPKTGDDTPILQLLSCLACAMILAGICAAVIRRRSSGE